MNKKFQSVFYLKLINKKSDDRKHRSRNVKCQQAINRKQTNLLGQRINETKYFFSKKHLHLPGSRGPQSQKLNI